METESDFDIPDSMTPEERRTKTHLDRHRITFVLGFLPIIFGIIGSGFHPIVGVILFALAGASWLVSGVSTISAKRHMFVFAGSGMSYVKVKPSGHAPITSAIIGVILIVLSLGLFNVALQIALATMFQPSR